MANFCQLSSCGPANLYMDGKTYALETSAASETNLLTCATSKPGLMARGWLVGGNVFRRRWSINSDIAQQTIHTYIKVGALCYAVPLATFHIRLSKCIH